MLMLVVLTLSACAHARTTTGPVPNPSFDLPQGNLTVAGSGGPKLSLHVQIAETAQSREQGLMGVKKMPDQVGMAFLFGEPTSIGFWMKDTLIPLTVAFIDEQWEIVELIDMAVAKDPQNGPFEIYKPAKTSHYALEVNQGFFPRKNLTVGAKVVYTLK